MYCIAITTRPGWIISNTETRPRRSKYKPKITDVSARVVFLRSVLLIVANHIRQREKEREKMKTDKGSKNRISRIRKGQIAMSLYQSTNMQDI